MYHNENHGSTKFIAMFKFKALEVHGSYPKRCLHDVQKQVQTQSLSVLCIINQNHDSRKFRAKLISKNLNSEPF